jgi:hypothetical protein
MAGADEHPLHGSDSQADLDELEIEDDDDTHEYTATLFGIDVGDGNVHNNVVDVDADDNGGGLRWQRQGLAPLTLMVPHPVVSANLLFGLILRRSRKMMLELLLSVRCVVRGCLLDLVLVLVI